ncbi:MAG TPA: DUF3048 domain-containing protein, partial [Candidatus Limnocylindria bacterium]|nr:DUF3048 domain-containing protein [Candidatus Limnocylindria bacterium]
MKKLVLLSLLLVLAASAAFAQEAPAATAIKSVLQRDVKPQGRNADGSFDANPAVPGMSPTTGLPVGTQPYVPILMQIDNNFGALPHWGVLHADIMYELPVAGGGLTRLTALFSDRHPSQAGPVRSARLMHADLREEWDALFIHFGEQTTEGSNFQQAVRDYGANKKGLVIDGIGNKYASYFTRTRYHGAPHNVSVDLKGFFDLMVQGGYQFPLRPFLFEDGVTPAGPDAVKISVIHKENEATAATYLYDVNRREYLRFTGKGIYQDLLSPQETLAYANVIVQRTKLAFNRRSSNPLLPEVVGSGAADIFIGGKYVAGAWSRATAQSRTVFLDAQGKEIVLQPGRTWIVITNE